MIIETVGSNLSLQDENLSIEAKKPFQQWSGKASFSDMRAFVKDVRTFFLDSTSRTLVETIRGITEPEVRGPTYWSAHDSVRHIIEEFLLVCKDPYVAGDGKFYPQSRYLRRPARR